MTFISKHDQEDSSFDSSTMISVEKAQSVNECTSLIDRSTDEPDSPHLYPVDVGYRPWLTLFGATCGMLPTFGYLVAIGIFQDYYQNNQLRDYSPSQISWINSLDIFLTIFLAVIVGPIYDVVGPRPLIIPGTIIMTLGVMLTSISTQYYQFILTQGILTPIGSALVFHAAAPATSSWFVKYRATAFGIGHAGSALGGAIMPVIFNGIEPKFGFGWAVRGIGFFMFGLSLICCVFTKSRVPPPGFQKIDFTKTYIRPFSQKPFLLLTIAVFFVFFGAFIPVAFIPSHAVSRGFSRESASYLITIFNAVSILGRIIPGITADRLGRFNTYAVCSFLAGLFTLALWIPAENRPAIILYSVLFGFFSGASVSLFQACVADITPSPEIGARLGTISAVMAFAALAGGPVAGAIISANGDRYFGAAIFTAVVMIFGALMTLVAKFYATKGNLWALS
ncbi:major facilitator superfamily domain-containing protein [Myxozyma melibiosi]|uniref:Major facilitator superfamily domain-containing protein n=1 Tax=Myxozyma melibiosi TaxID=54550 RepID=A0ABR1F937_9ASCO